MLCMLKNKKVYPACVSKHSTNCEKYIILLMIPKEERWHYLTVRNGKFSALLRRKTSKHHGDSYSLNCHHSFVTKNKFESHKKVWEHNDL